MGELLYDREFIFDSVVSSSYDEFSVGVSVLFFGFEYVDFEDFHGLGMRLHNICGQNLR